MMTQNKPIVDLSEKGKGRDGQPISLDRRLFMQFLAYGNCTNIEALVEVLPQAGLGGALYTDVNDPQGVGLVMMTERPDDYITQLRPILNQAPFTDLEPKPEYTMLGRTYTIGYEHDLEETLFARPRRRVLDPNLRWAIWYPVQRSKSFETLPDKDQKRVLSEHGGIGKTFGQTGYATDIRLACHGLDKHDNDFVIGVLGKELYPLSALIQRMRKTEQTSQYLDRLGPFFVGQVVWQSEM